MGRGNNYKYSRRELIDIVTKLGFSVDTNNGKTMGKGDHVVYSHALYKELKVNIPVRKDLGENEMSDICSNIVIIMKILGVETSIFTHKEGVEGKLMKTAKNAEKDICILFTTVVKNCLGVRDEKEIKAYIVQKQQEIEAARKNSTDTVEQ